MSDFILKMLPPNKDVETKRILKQTALSNRFLAELKGVSEAIPNQNILIYTLPLIEAKDSSAIENIITTHDDLYKEDLFENLIKSPAAKEVRDYASALRKGFQLVKEKGLLIFIINLNQFILSMMGTAALAVF